MVSTGDSNVRLTVVQLHCLTTLITK